MNLTAAKIIAEIAKLAADSYVAVRDATKANRIAQLEKELAELKP